VSIIAGVSWTQHGYEVSVSSSPEVAEFRACEFGALLGYLHGLRDSGRVSCVVDTSNCQVAERLAAAGLRVIRLDPQFVPPEYRGRRVPAAVLAELGARYGDQLVAVGTEGILADRYGEVTATPMSDYLSGLISYRLPVSASEVYLTFDDGPSDYTYSVLRILERFGASASFFAVGLNVIAHSGCIAATFGAGHTVANHTWSHPYVRDATQDSLRFQLASTSEAIAQITGQPCAYFRPPFGTRTAEVLIPAHEAGLRTMLWSHDSSDWAGLGSAAIIQNCMADISPGSVVLLHDGGGDRAQTVDALPVILRRLKALGLAASALPPAWGQA
jgi:peptidoglycan/xylan/chitin deacetylase (PgdA/CDA1 family)